MQGVGRIGFHDKGLAGLGALLGGSGGLST